MNERRQIRQRRTSACELKLDRDRAPDLEDRRAVDPDRRQKVRPRIRDGELPTDAGCRVVVAVSRLLGSHRAQPSRHERDRRPRHAAGAGRGERHIQP